MHAHQIAKKSKVCLAWSLLVEEKQDYYYIKARNRPTSFNCFSNPLTHVVNIDNKEDNKEDDTLH